MQNKKTKWLLWGSMALCCGCVDNAYDLNKDIVMDVTIAGNKVTLPVSNMKPIVLDSLIDVDDIDLLEKMDGVYALKKSDVIDPIDIDIDPIKINIDPITHNTTFQFDEVTIEEAVLNEIEKNQTFGVNEVSIEDLNEELPTLATEVTTGVLSPELEGQLLALKESGIEQEITTSFAYTVKTGVQKVNFELSYEFPKEIKEITDITLNNLIKFKVTNPAILDGASKTISFNATFPEGFVLRKDESAPHADKYVVDGRTVKVGGVESQGDEIFVQFYIEALTGLEERIDNGAISFDDVIEYEVEYTVDGNVTISNKTELEDFDFLVAMDHKVSFEDAKGSTNEIEVDFDPMDFDFSAHFDNLEHIKEVEYIEFDAANSKINFTTDLGDGGFAPFNLKEGCQLKLSFPDKFILDLEKCVYPEGVTYNDSEHAFFISDVNVLNGFQWQLAVDRVNVYTEVIDHKCDLNATASISVVPATGDETLKLGATAVESFNTTLESLKSKNVIFTMAETHMHIDDAVVLTETIHEEIDESTSFSINEKVDEGVKRIESVEFGKKVPITLNVAMTGVEDIDTDIHLRMNVELPSFLILSSTDERVQIEGNKLSVNADYNPQSNNGKLTINLLGEKLHFTGEEFPNGIELRDSTDDNYYLVYEDSIPIYGEAYIDETEMHSTILGKDIGIDVDFTIEEMNVEKFSGIYCGEIDDIYETIEFDLGEDLDFLKDEGNTVTLADPQIMFTIDNPVSIPVDLALSIFGKDDNGKEIEGSRVETVIRLEPAEYIEATGEVNKRDMKFLLTNKETLLDGYTNIVVQDLSNLLTRIPNTLDIELKPTIVEENVIHHVDLSKELVFHPTYEVVAPLEFDNVHIEYTELVDDLNKDLGEALEHFANIEVRGNMNIRNTVPVALTLTVEPLDIYGNVIENVTVEEVKIAAGNGENIKDSDSEENQGEQLQLVVKSKGDVLRRLDKLNLLIKGDADHTVGGKPFTPGQGVHITDIVLEVVGDVDTNLDEL